jgi:hypothetical protein
MMIAVTLLLASLLARAPEAPPAGGASHVHASDEAQIVPDGPARIPFDLRGNHIYLRGRLNDSDSLWIVLDTGASGNVVDADLAKRLGMEVVGGGRGQGAGGVVEAGRIASVTVRLPGVTLARAPIAAMPLTPFERQTGRRMDAIIGHPLLERFVVKVDYAARMLEIRSAEGFEYQGTGAVLPLTFDRNLPYVTAKVKLPGRKPIAGRFVIDSGSSQALILSPRVVRAEHVHDVIGKTIEARGRGVGGQIPSRVGRVERLEFAGVAFERPITMLPVPDDAHIGASGMVGNIGGDILRRFTIIYDYARRRMILEPNAQVADPFEADMSGMAPRMGPAGSQALEVEWIQAESPASEAGVRAGDLIEQVDGRPALEVGVPGLREMFRRAGETHRFTIRRGDQRMEIALTTRRLI